MTPKSSRPDHMPTRGQDVERRECLCKSVDERYRDKTFDSRSGRVKCHLVSIECGAAWGRVDGIVEEDVACFESGNFSNEGIEFGANVAKNCHCCGVKRHVMAVHDLL